MGEHYTKWVNTMSKKGSEENGLEKALVKFASLLVDLSQETNHKIDKLADSNERISLALQQLAQAQIRSEERHNQYDERSERFELNQRDQGKEIKNLSDAQLLMGKDIEAIADWRAGFKKIFIGVITALSIGTVVAIMKLMK